MTDFTSSKLLDFPIQLKSDCSEKLNPKSELSPPGRPGQDHIVPAHTNLNLNSTYQYSCCIKLWSSRLILEASLISVSSSACSMGYGAVDHDDNNSISWLHPTLIMKTLNCPTLPSRGHLDGHWLIILHLEYIQHNSTQRYNKTQYEFNV